MDILLPGRYGLGKNTEKLITFQNSFSLFPHMLEKKLCILLMSKKPFNQIVKFMAPGSGVQILGLGQYVKKRLNLKIYSVLPYIFEKKLNAYVCKVFPPPPPPGRDFVL